MVSKLAWVSLTSHLSPLTFHLSPFTSHAPPPPRAIILYRDTSNHGRCTDNFVTDLHFSSQLMQILMMISWGPVVRRN